MEIDGDRKSCMAIDAVLLGLGVDLSCSVLIMSVCFFLWLVLAALLWLGYVFIQPL